eukprot:SAG31_NODE_19848_length_590_cov_0.936864_1_plen_36_part_01
MIMIVRRMVWLSRILLLVTQLLPAAAVTLSNKEPRR